MFFKFRISKLAYRVWTKTEIVRPESFPQREHSFMTANFHEDVNRSFVLLGAVRADLHVLNSKSQKLKVSSMLNFCSFHPNHLTLS